MERCTSVSPLKEIEDEVDRETNRDKNVHAGKMQRREMLCVLNVLWLRRLERLGR